METYARVKDDCKLQTTRFAKRKIILDFGSDDDVAIGQWKKKVCAIAQRSTNKTLLWRSLFVWFNNFRLHTLQRWYGNDDDRAHDRYIRYQAGHLIAVSVDLCMELHVISRNFTCHTSSTTACKIEYQCNCLLLLGFEKIGCLSCLHDLPAFQPASSFVMSQHVHACLHRSHLTTGSNAMRTKAFQMKKMNTAVRAVNETKPKKTKTRWKIHFAFKVECTGSMSDESSDCSQSSPIFKIRTNCLSFLHFFSQFIFKVSLHTSHVSPDSQITKEEHRKKMVLISLLNKHT